MSNNIQNEFKDAQSFPDAAYYKGNTLEYQRFQNIAGEDGISLNNNTQNINDGLLTSLGKPQSVDFNNMNSYRMIEKINPTNGQYILKNSISTKYQEPLNDKDVIFKYVPLNNVKNMLSQRNSVYSNQELNKSDYYRLLLVSMISFIICYIESEGCSSGQRIIKSFIAGLLGIVYIFAYLIKYTLVKCS